MTTNFVRDIREVLLEERLREHQRLLDNQALFFGNTTAAVTPNAFTTTGITTLNFDQITYGANATVNRWRIDQMNTEIQGLRIRPVPIRGPYFDAVLDNEAYAFALQNPTNPINTNPFPAYTKKSPQLTLDELRRSVWNRMEKAIRNWQHRASPTTEFIPGELEGQVKVFGHIIAWVKNTPSKPVIRICLPVTSKEELKLIRYRLRQIGYSVRAYGRHEIIRYNSVVIGSKITERLYYGKAFPVPVDVWEKLHPINTPLEVNVSNRESSVQLELPGMPQKALSVKDIINGRIYSSQDNAGITRWTTT